MNSNRLIGDDAVVSMFDLNAQSLTDSALSAALRHRLGAVRDIAQREINRRIDAYIDKNFHGIRAEYEAFGAAMDRFND